MRTKTENSWRRYIVNLGFPRFLYSPASKLRFEIIGMQLFLVVIEEDEEDETARRWTYKSMSQVVCRLSLQEWVSPVRQQHKLRQEDAVSDGQRMQPKWAEFFFLLLLFLETF